MPTNKPSFTFHIDSEYLQKLRYISKYQVRSMSNLLEFICKDFIDNFERENGEIKIENQEQE